MTCSEALQDINRVITSGPGTSLSSPFYIILRGTTGSGIGSLLRKVSNWLTQGLLSFESWAAVKRGLMDAIMDIEESEVLITLIAERYERHSLGTTSNLVFSEWEKVFSNPMATAALIDRIMHHLVKLKYEMPSYRTSEAQGRRLHTTITLDPSGQSNCRCPRSAAY